MKKDIFVKAFRKFKYSYYDLLGELRSNIGALLIKISHYRYIGYIKKIEGKRKLIVSERYARFVKISSRIILIISIVTAFIAIPSPYSIFISLGMVLIEQILERTTFYFISILVVDFPEWSLWKKAGFTAMIFGKAEDPRMPLLVGMAFTGEEAARNVWTYIEGWAGSDDDVGNNLSLSIIINEKAKSYAVFVYPSYDRPASKQFNKKLESLKENKDKEHISLQAQMMIIKMFPLRSNSSLSSIFIPNYEDGDPYIFRPYIHKNGSTKAISGIKGIFKHHIKIKHVKDITRKDPEYHSVKYDLVWNKDDSSVPQSIYKESQVERFE